MTEHPPPVSCFVCSRPETETPLLRLQFSGSENHICPQCLPVLIHHPEKLAEKLIELRR